MAAQHETCRSQAPVTWKNVIKADDIGRIRDLVAATMVFSETEQDIAVEIAAEYLQRGADSGYAFELAMRESELMGYACYGQIPGSEISWDLYWIAVHPAHQGIGLGANLLGRVEYEVKGADGLFIYADTSSSSLYSGTRAFYVAQGFLVAAEFPDFYRPGDGKTVFRKALQ